MNQTQRTPLIAGNWKMNFDHFQAIATVQKLSWSLADVRHDYAEVEVVVMPPFTDLRSVQTLLSADKIDIGLGAQDLSQYDSGAYTGDISGAFLAKLNVDYVLVGHSERRKVHEETNDLIAAKAKAAVKYGLVPIICVGETANDLEEHGASTIPLEQLSVVLQALPENSKYVVAYEPVWAIGSGNAATPEQANEVAQLIRERIHELRGETDAESTRVLYGGSVTSQNVATYLRQADVDGVLVGGASLKAEEFSKIAQFKKHIIA